MSQIRSSLAALIAIIALVWGATIQNTTINNESDELTNRLIDEAIYRLRNYSNIDPYHLHKDYSLELHQQLGVLPFDFCFSSCNFGIRNGTMYGLSRMRRCSNGTFDNEDRDLLARFVLCTDNIALGSNVTFHIGPVELFNVPLRSLVGSLQIKLILVVRGKIISLRYLHVKRIERVRIRPLEPIGTNSTTDKDAGGLKDMFTNMFLEYFNRFARKVLSRALFAILSEEIQFMQNDNH